MPAELQTRCRHAAASLWIIIVAVAGLSGGEAQADGLQRAVAIEAMQFSPPIMEVKVGDVVTWTNKDPFPHTVTAENRSFDSGEMPIDGVWKMTAKQKGTFAYRCTLHPTMHGTLIVK